MPLVPAFVSSPVGAVYGNVTSKTAQRAYIQTILATFLSLILLGLACSGYILFYLSYIPQIGLDTDVHLIYGSPTCAARNIAGITNDILIYGQPYDVYVSLTLPTSPRNIQTGAFMVNLTLFNELTPSPQPLAKSVRPVSLTYKSPIIDVIDTIIRSPLYLTGLRREEESISVLMMEEQVFDKNQMPKHLGLQVGGEQIFGNCPMAYTSKVRFRAKFKGLRYFMYNHRIIAFATFTSAFWMTEMFWASIAWMLLVSWLSPVENNKDENTGGQKRVTDKAETTTPPTEKLTSSSEKESRTIHPLAPADDDSEEIPRPRGIYATPEATPAPEGHDGDDEDSEDFRNDISDEGGRTPTSTDENNLYGSAHDSGVGTSLSERGSDGLTRRRTGRGNE